MGVPDIETMLTPQEAAELLGVSIQTLARMRRKKEIEGFQVGKSNLYVFRLSDIRKLPKGPKKRGPKPKTEK